MILQTVSPENWTTESIIGPELNNVTVPTDVVQTPRLGVAHEV